MAIKVSCVCGKKLAVKDELAGKKVKCPACQKLLSIPKPKAAEESLDDEWDLGDSAEEDFADEPSEVPAKSRGAKSAASPGSVSRKGKAKGQGKKSSGSNRGLLIGLSAGGGVLVVALLTWMLWPAAPAANVAGNPPANQEQSPASASGDAAKVTNSDEVQQRHEKLKAISLALSKSLSADFRKKGYPAGFSDPEGKLILSWRVAILPALGEEELWKQFRLDEPWDSEHNRQLISKMPAVFKPVRGGSKEGHTYYRGFAGKDAMFPLKSSAIEKVQVGDRSCFPVFCRPFINITDGTSNTFLIAEAGETVPWTEPEELVYDAKLPLPKLGGQFDGDFMAMVSDGATRLMTHTIPEPALRAAITAAQGENIQFRPAGESGFTVEYVTAEMEARKYALGNQAEKSPHASLAQITDATNETAFAGIVAEGRAVPWTKPDDLVFDDTFQTKDNANNGFVPGAFLFADGSVRYLHIQEGLDRVQFRALFTIAGKEPSPLTSLYPPGHNLVQPTYATTQEQVRHAGARTENLKSLKEIALAFHNYQQVYKHLPPAVVYGPDGKPWHSWRVLILPFLEQGGAQLYQQYDGTVPWDHPKNAAVLAAMPPVYRDPLADKPIHKTRYLLATGPGTAFPTKPPASDVTGDLQALQGDWHIVDLQQDPPAPPQLLAGLKLATVTFAGDSMTIDHGSAVPGARKETVTIKLDASQNPKTIDSTNVDGPRKGQTSPGIYSLEGDVLKLHAGKSRPTSWTLIKERQSTVMVFKRGRPAAVANAQPLEDKFDHKAWQRVQPTLRPLGIQSQLLTRLEAPESIPEGLQAVAVLVLPDLSASDRYPDNILATIKSLSHVIVKTVEMNDAKLKQLSEHPGLIGLNLSGKSVITADGLRTLKQCPLFRHLHLEQVSLAPLDLMTMIDELNKLSSLSVNDMPVTDNLLVYLQVLKGLDTLSLQNTSVTDTGTAQLAKLSSLKALLLDGSKVTDQGLPALKSLDKLTLLSLRRLNVSPQAVDELKKTLPGCNILK